MTLRFHKRIYSAVAVRAAVEAFEGIAKVDVAEDGDYITASVETEGPESDREVAREFDNYVLGETISAKRGES